MGGTDGNNQTKKSVSSYSFSCCILIPLAVCGKGLNKIDRGHRAHSHSVPSVQGSKQEGKDRICDIGSTMLRKSCKSSLHAEAR